MARLEVHDAIDDQRCRLDTEGGRGSRDVKRIDGDLIDPAQLKLGDIIVVYQRLRVEVSVARIVGGVGPIGVAALSASPFVARLGEHQDHGDGQN